MSVKDFVKNVSDNYGSKVMNFPDMKRFTFLRKISKESAALSGGECNLMLTIFS